jgi:hypothetical protein
MTKYKYLNNIESFKIFIEIFVTNGADVLILHCNRSLNNILWGDEIFGRHTLSSRGWGSQDKRSIEPTLLLVRPTRVDH